MTISNMFDFVKSVSGTSFTVQKATKLFNFDNYGTLREDLTRHIVKNAKNASRKRVFSEQSNNVYYEQDASATELIKTVTCEWHVLDSDEFAIHIVEVSMSGSVSKVVIVNGPDRNDYFETHGVILMRMQPTFFDVGAAVRSWMTDKFEVSITDIELGSSFLQSELDREVPSVAHLKLETLDLGGLLKYLTLGVQYEDAVKFAEHEDGLYAGITEFVYDTTGMKANTSNQFVLVSLLTNVLMIDKRGKLKIIRTGLPQNGEFEWIEGFLTRLVQYARA